MLTTQPFDYIFTTETDKQSRRYGIWNKSLFSPFIAWIEVFALWNVLFRAVLKYRKVDLKFRRKIEPRIFLIYLFLRYDNLFVFHKMIKKHLRDKTFELV